MPSDERERAAQEAFVERLAISARARRGRGRRVRGLGDRRAGCTRCARCFDLMDTSHRRGLGQRRPRRLAAVPATLTDYRRTLTEAADRGPGLGPTAVPPHRRAGPRLDRREGRRAASSPGSWRPRPSARAAGLRAAADAATAAYADFGRFLSEEMAPRGRERDGVGREHYQLASRYFLGATVDLDEAYRWGWAELARIREDMARTAERILPGADVEDAVAHLRRRPRAVDRGHRGVPGLDAGPGRPHRRGDGRGALRRRPTRCAASSAASRRPQDGGIYYTGPSEDFSRPGRMWWSVPAGVTHFQKWEQVSTVYHEGVPGPSPPGRADLLPRRPAQPVAAADVLGLRQRRGLGVVRRAPHGRARLPRRPGRPPRHAGRAGLPRGAGGGRHRRPPRAGDPGRQPARASTPARPGTPTWCSSSCATTAGWTRARSAFEVNRYLGWPGQAPSYKLGERVWLQARDDAQGAPRRRLRPQGLPPPRARPRLDRAGPAGAGAGAAVSAPAPERRAARAPRAAHRRRARGGPARRRDRRSPRPATCRRG